MAASFLLLLLICASGCDPNAGHFVGGDRPPNPEARWAYTPPPDFPDNAALTVLSSGVYLVLIDGGDPPRFSRGQTTLRVPLRPGIHHVVTGWAAGNQYSLHHAEVTFAAEPGRDYRLQQWPPQVIDVKTSAPVHVHLRVTK